MRWFVADVLVNQFDSVMFFVQDIENQVGWQSKAITKQSSGTESIMYAGTE